MATESIYIIRASLNNGVTSIQKKRKGSTEIQSLEYQAFLDAIFSPEMTYEIPDITVILAKTGTNLPTGMTNYLKVVNLIYDNRYSSVRLIAISPTINGTSKALDILITNTGNKGICSTLALA